MEKTFYHYSDEAGLNINNILLSKAPGFKPGGLWLSDDSNDYGWANWCKNEDFRLEQLRYRYPIRVNLDSILVLDTHHKLLQFLNKYSVNSSMLENIDWGGVALDYKGIAFTPYNRGWSFEEANMHRLIWYSTIDCDSACVWDKSAITHFGKPELTGIEKC